MATYRTRDGDMLDAICLSYYGQADGYLEPVLTSNPGLADMGPVYPSGLLIELPNLSEQNRSQETIRLWS
ncbi:tail protein X [Aestuariirhabdus haliotis]|uniref:tail protein X n=1 Tax=Aestuariirhabdus haliotis TaxID=2918751 RepID=UPI003872B363